jgi:hypothetical protein
MWTDHVHGARFPKQMTESLLSQPIARSLSLQRPPSSIILGTRGLEALVTWAVPSRWGTVTVTDFVIQVT